jgi:hypothetical protein
MQRRVFWWVSSYVQDAPSAYIFKLEMYHEREVAVNSEKLVTICQNKRRQNPGNRKLDTHRRDNLKSQRKKLRWQPSWMFPAVAYWSDASVLEESLLTILPWKRRQKIWPKHWYQLPNYTTSHPRRNIYWYCCQNLQHRNINSVHHLLARN